MSEITVRYKMTVDDLVNFNDVAFKKKTLMMRVICLFCALMTGFISVMAENIKLAVTEAVIFLIIGIAYPYILRYTTRKHYVNAFILDKENQLEFYNDHLVEKVLPSYEGAYESEIHVPFEKILNITETDEMFLFFLTPIEAIGVPKKFFTKEDRVKLFHLIDNVFSTRFTRTNLRKAMKNDKSNNGKRG